MLKRNSTVHYDNLAMQPRPKRGAFAIGCLPAWTERGDDIDGGGIEER
jgi:hypothetical protein